MCHVNMTWIFYLFLNCWRTHLEGAEVLSYLVSCRVETAVSHPGLATDTEEYYFLES